MGKRYSFDEVKGRYYETIGTEKRDSFEEKLKQDIKMANTIQFTGTNLQEVINFLGIEYITHYSANEDPEQTVIQFWHAGGYPVNADIWDVFTKEADGDIYLESRMAR